MTDTELEVAFYKGSAVHDVLKRFKFSDDEKRIITAAILTARKQTPDIQAISKADELLRDVAKTREPIQPTTKTKVSPEALAKIEALSHKQKARTRKQEEVSSRNSNFLQLNSKMNVVYIGSILLAFMIYNSTQKNTSTNEPVTFTEAQTICIDQDKILPLTYFDLDRQMRQPTSKNEIGYWTAERKIAYNIARPFIEDDKQKHYVKCVKKSGLEYPTLMR